GPPEARDDAVAWLGARLVARESLADTLGALPDLERLASRAAQRSLNPREMLAIAAAARRLPAIRDGLSGGASPLLDELGCQIGDFRELAEQAERTIEDPPPAGFGDGVIRRGCSAELDEVRSLAGDTR